MVSNRLDPVDGARAATEWGAAPDPSDRSIDPRGVCARGASSRGGRIDDETRGMVLYEAMILVSAKAPRTACADVLRRLGTRVMQTGGVVTDVASYGARTLAYEFRRPGEKHFEVRRASRRVVRVTQRGGGARARARGAAARGFEVCAEERESARARGRDARAEGVRRRGVVRDVSERVRERVTDGGACGWGVRAHRRNS